MKNHRNVQHNGRVTPKRHRIVGAAGIATLALSSAGVAGLMTAGNAFAVVAPITSSPYVIGAGSVSNPTLSATPTTASAASTWTLGFTTPVAIPAAGTVTVAGSSTSGLAFSAAFGSYTVLDSNPAGSGAVTAVANSAGAVTMTLQKAVSAGDTLSITMPVTTNPSAAGAFTVNVSTSASTLPVASTPITITAVAAASTPTATSASVAPNATTTETLSNYTGVSVAANGALNIAATATANGALPGINFSAVAADYSISDTTSGGTTTTIVPTAVATGGALGGVGTPTTNTLALTVPSAIASTDTLKVTLNNVRNPTAVESDFFQVGGAPAQSAATTINYGSAVTGVTLSASPTTALAAAQYTLSFKATSGVANASTIVVSGPAGVFSSGNVLISDATTSGDSQTAAGVANGPGSTLTITTSHAIAAGDTVTLTIIGVTNPANGTYSATTTPFTVSTALDNLAVVAPALTITGGTTSSPFTVTANPPTPTASSTYTLQGIEADAAIPAGTPITISAPAGTVFPGTASSYTITDSTTASGTAAAAAVTGGAGTNTITFTTSNAIAANDMLTVTANGVINPAANAGAQVTIGTLAAATELLEAALVPISSSAPTAATTYPSGGLINVGGAFYVTAGGFAFHIPDIPTYLSLIANNPAGLVTASSLPSTSAPRPGTLITVINQPAIYVVGNDGKLYAFSSPSNFLGDGYDPDMVVQVPSTGGLTIGSGAAPTADVTKSDGALVIDTSGAIWEYAGGQAFHIPNPTALLAIMPFDPATVVPGTVTAGTVAGIATGTVEASVSGTTGLGAVGAINVISAGAPVPFSSVASWLASGYDPQFTLTLP